MRSARESSRPPRPRTARHGRPVAFQRRERFLSRVFSALRLCNARSASGDLLPEPVTSPDLSAPTVCFHQADRHTYVVKNV